MDSPRTVNRACTQVPRSVRGSGTRRIQIYSVACHKEEDLLLTCATLHSITIPSVDIRGLTVVSREDQGSSLWDKRGQ